jgi:hypothetical protein
VFRLEAPVRITPCRWHCTQQRQMIYHARIQLAILSGRGAGANAARNLKAEACSFL